VFNGVPVSMKEINFERIEKAENAKVSRFVTLKDVAEIMGMKVE
jgi:hypothetical protein